MRFDRISRHFSIERLSEGIYAAIHKEGGAAICNSGLIDLGGQIVVFDTFLTPQASKDLLDFSIDIFERAPDFIVNSHYHNDHTWGNQTFSGFSKFISSDGTLKLFETEGKAELDWYRANSVEQLHIYRERYRLASDAKEREGINMMVGYYEGLVEALPNLVAIKPDITFDKELTLHGEKRDAELISFDKAHTGSDAVMFLPEEGILFTGDLLFVDSHPYLPEGDPEKLIDALMAITGWDASIFVPGHGGIGTRNDILLLIEYVRFCIETAADAICQGRGKECLSDVSVPSSFENWHMPNMFRSNLNSIYDRMKDQRPKIA